MGLTIHYSGKLRNPSDLTLLIDEATDIANSMQWHHQRLPEAEGIPIDGVLITPEGSEPIWLTFHLHHGLMINPILYSCILDSTNEDVPEDAVSGLFTKTQYAGAEVHMAIIKFLRYLSQKYFAHFELYDESNYWETMDDDACRARFGESGHIIKAVGEALDEMTFDPDESEESITMKIEKMLEEKFGMTKSEE